MIKKMATAIVYFLFVMYVCIEILTLPKGYYPFDDTDSIIRFCFMLGSAFVLYYLGGVILLEADKLSDKLDEKNNQEK